MFQGIFSLDNYIFQIIQSRIDEHQQHFLRQRLYKLIHLNVKKLEFVIFTSKHPNIFLNHLN